MATQSHRSDPRILGRRTLERDHRCLARRLRPGLSVLDVGCGTGAIAVGIARAVGPRGYAVGVDRDEGLLELARKEHAGVSNLRFERGDATALRFQAEFDIVTAARTLQWIADPARTVASMKQAAKPSGMVVVLDYSHMRNAWEPAPPAAFRLFYRAFLAWREANGWDNDMADHLADLFRAAGLVEVASYVEDEVAQRGDSDFDARTTLWSEVIENVGAPIAAAGFCTERDLAEARREYADWVKTELVTQTLAMRGVTGMRAA
jgi:SAM-dependent methyltransferase